MKYKHSVPEGTLSKAYKVWNVVGTGEASQVLKPLRVDKVVEGEHDCQAMPAYWAEQGISSHGEMGFPGTTALRVERQCRHIQTTAQEQGSGHTIFNCLTGVGRLVKGQHLRQHFSAALQCQQHHQHYYSNTDNQPHIRATATKHCTHGT